MTDDEQILQAIARAFETLSERLSKELEDAVNQMAQLMGRAQKQQYEIVALFGKQAAAMKALRTCLRRCGTTISSAATNTPPLSSSYHRAR
jgi:hypothetical protein